MIERTIESAIRKHIGSQKAIIIMGPRQVGKSTLLHKIFDEKKDSVWYDADDINTRGLFENATSEQMKVLVGKNKYVIIDEAQSLTNAGLTLKRITDYIDGVQVIATGSSSFELADKIKEAMTGRKWEYCLFPISFAEMASHTNVITEDSMITHRMVYGYYPEVVNNPGEEKEVLSTLASDYLYKDILKIESIKKTDKLIRLLRALALQVGSQVSYNEVGQTCGLDSKTVEKYIDVLEQSYIIFRLCSYSSNLRNELKKSRKIYFYDLGIRNAILNNFTPFENRDSREKGSLWENFLIVERIKYAEYNRFFCNRYFWRTKQQNEIDYIEEYDGKLHTYEFKLTKGTDTKYPSLFMNTYKDSTHEVINRDNFYSFIMK
jgi:predicted AAA+ superfamily ATPase